MSKVEDLSRQYVLPFLDNHYEKYGEHKQMELSRFDGYDVMSAYEEGYLDAEKDLELTWVDMEKIVDLYEDIYCDFYGNGGKTNTEEHYQEVLKRFKNFRERKEKCQ